MDFFYFSLKNFVDTKEVSFSKLFDENEAGWTILKNLPYLFSKMTLGKIDAFIPSNVYLIDPRNISIGKNTIIEPGAYIKGPALIGESCLIRHGAYIRGNVITGSNCVIGHSTEVKNSIFFNKATAAHFAYVGDSILGNNVNLGAGVKLANFRLDKKTISFSYDGKKIETSLKKFGAIVGDNVQIGCNSVLNPATFIGKGSFCFPSLNLSGVIPEGSKVKAQTKLIISKM